MNVATEILLSGKRTRGASERFEVQQFESSGVADGTIVPDSVDDVNRTIELIFTTGEAGKRHHWDIGEYMEELEISPGAIRTDRLDKGLSVCDNHDTYTGSKGVYGVTMPSVNGNVHYTIANGELRGKVKFADDPEAEIIWQRVKQGILRHWSLGYDVHEFRASIIEGKLPHYLAVDWTPLELSIVPVSFETTNGSRTKPTSGLHNVKITQKESLIMTAAQLARLALLQGMSTRNATEETEMGTLVALRNAQPANPNPAVAAAVTAAVAPVVAPVTAERSIAPVVAPVIQTGITPADMQAALQQRSIDQVALTATCRSLQVDESIAITGLQAGNDAATVRMLILDAAEQRSNANTPVPSSGGGRNALASGTEHNQRAMEMEGITNLLLSRTSGNDGVEVSDFGRQFTGMGMAEIARHYMNATGESVMGMSPIAFAQRAFMSTSDFPLIFENVMNKNLQNHYEAEEQTWRDLCTKSTVRDFREKHLYQVGDAPDLLPLAENGEYRAGTFGEAKERMNISTFARSIGFSRQMFVNDDMGALDMFPRMWGSAASRLESDIVWGQILNKNYVLWNLQKRKGSIPSLGHTMEDGKELFHADHGNLHVGTASALVDTGLSQLRMDGHKTATIDGNRMPVKWGQIVLPYELEDQADRLLQARITATTSADVNLWAGKFPYRVEPRLSDVSSKAWLAFAAGSMKSVEYAYLEGNEGVYTETVQSHDVDGMKSIVRHDFGAGVADHRYIHRSKGEA